MILKLNFRESVDGNVERIDITLLCSKGKAAKLYRRDASQFSCVVNHFKRSFPIFLLLIPCVGDENCLTLNVFNKYENSTWLKPVMFWIHGGGFVFGSGSGAISY